MAAHKLPAWSWAFVAFRIGDGASHALLLLAVALSYDMPVWAVAATSALLNLVSVPATFLWAKAMDGGRRRRRIAVVGFAVAAAAILLAGSLPPFWLYLVALSVYTAFGVATGPAASTLVLENVPRAAWSRTSGALSRRTSIGYLAGIIAVTGVGLSGNLHVPTAFLVTAALSAVAAVIAVWTIPPGTRGTPVGRFDAHTIRQQGRFERIVYAPFRMFNRPTWRGIRDTLAGPAGPVLWSTTLIFTGSLLFFASYPGVLVDRLGLAAGLALLAQTPSHLTTLASFPAAGIAGDRFGWGRAYAVGAALRMAALPMLVITMLWWDLIGWWGLVAAHGLIGVSFAFLQVNGPLLAASMQQQRGQGVGAFHAALAFGTLLGAAWAFLLLLITPLWVSYVGAMALTWAGGWVAWRLRRLSSAAL